MNRAGSFFKRPRLALKLLVSLQGFWLFVLLVMALWWGTLLQRFSDRVSIDERKLGTDEATISNERHHLHHMLVWESGSFLAIFFICNGLLIFYYFREERRSRSLESFFAAVTHELRTPLTGIRLQTEAIADAAPVDSNIQRWSTRLLTDVERLEAQVQRTLELARVEAGADLLLQPVDFQRWLERWIQQSSSLVQERMSVATEGSLPGRIQADPAALSVIFRNLFENATRYSLDPKAIVRIFLTSQTNGATIRVVHENSDLQGTPSELGKLFSRGKKSSGAGVGLYLISALVKAMKGQVQFHANSTAPKSTFECTLAFQASEADA